MTHTSDISYNHYYTIFASFSSPKETTLISTVTSTGSPLNTKKEKDLVNNIFKINWISNLICSFCRLFDKKMMRRGVL